MQKLTFYGQIEGSRLAERFAAKTNLETGDEEKTIRSERVRSVMKLMYANTMKMSRTRAGASDVLVTTNNRPLIAKTNLDQGQVLIPPTLISFM